MGGAMKAQGALTLTSGCAGCDLLGQLMLQIQPFLGALGPVLCILGCVGSVIKVAQAVPGIVGPPPDPSKLLSALANMLIKCKCVIELAMPFPIGALCEFLKMVADLIHIIVSVIACIVGLLQHLISLNLKANLLLLDVDTVQAGNCLLDQSQGMTDMLVTKMGAIAALIEAIQPIFDILSTVPGLSVPIGDLSTALGVFTGAVSIGVTPPAEVLLALQDLQSVLQTVDSVVGGIASVCP